jgi:molybdopterin synthase catalytic subunit
MIQNCLIDGPLTLKEITPLFESMTFKATAGGHSVFIGQVRADESGGKTVMAIEYSAYEAMVKAEADKIKTEILSEFADVQSVDILHSTGVVKAGELSLFVLVSAGHRQQAIKACAKAVELIKERLPVWKKEIYEDNSHIWLQNH